MPIDRMDGKHWCAPSLEAPDADGRWVCPCGQVWVTADRINWKRED